MMKNINSFRVIVLLMFYFSHNNLLTALEDFFQVCLKVPGKISQDEKE